MPDHNVDPIARVDAATDALRGAGIPAHAWAYLAAEAIRGLNHTTLTPSAYRSPGEVYTVIGELTSLLQRLPQALHQAVGALEAMDHAGGVRDVTDPDQTTTTVVEIAKQLTSAGVGTAYAAERLAAGHVPAGRLAARQQPTTGTGTGNSTGTGIDGAGPGQR